ncbi:saccharopine dehydrogenase, partial [Frankia sp. AiPs1]|nr:saccharopine dehydrogenase [Frankia sp. AiPs1]
MAAAGGVPTRSENFMQSPDAAPPGHGAAAGDRPGNPAGDLGNPPGRPDLPDRSPGTIVVFGATGYTGRLVTAELVAAGHRPVLA